MAYLLRLCACCLDVSAAEGGLGLELCVSIRCVTCMPPCVDSVVVWGSKPGTDCGSLGGDRLLVSVLLCLRFCMNLATV